MRRAAALATALAAVLLLGAAARPPEPLPGYARDDRDCDGYPRAPIEMMTGLCAGIIFAPPPEGLRPSKRRIRLPRTLLALPDGDVLVVDLGSWEPGHGAVWRLSPDRGGEPRLTRLLEKLDLPHTIAVGPDGRLYLGEMNRIRRFDPEASDPQASLETVVTDLPGNRLHTNRHPLSSFVFDADGSLLVNVGAPTDQCPPKPGETRCAEAEGEGRRVHAAIWRFAYQGAGQWDSAYTVFASGLRNSLAMVRTRAGTLLQAENNIDVADRFWPPEELNLLTSGGHYGWPYCVGLGETAPAWRGVAGVDCKIYQNPRLQLPPHGAPLSLVEYHGAMFPQLEGRLLVSLHGYRATGSRILALALDSKGLPKTSPRPGYSVYAAGGRTMRRAYGPGPAQDGLLLTPGWGAVPGRRPAGSPVGLAVAPDGAIWVAEDRNGAILRIARDRR